MGFFYIFPSVFSLWPSCISSLVHSFILSFGIKFRKPGSLGAAATDGILTQLWLSLPVAHTMTKYQLAFSLVLLTDEPNKPSTSTCVLRRMVETSLNCGGMIHDLKITWQWSVSTCSHRRYLYSSTSHKKFWRLAADISEMQAKQSCNFFKKGHNLSLEKLELLKKFNSFLKGIL